MPRAGMLVMRTRPSSRNARSRQPLISICTALTSVSTLTITAASGSDMTPVRAIAPMVMSPNAKPVSVCAKAAMKTSARKPTSSTGDIR